MNPPLHAKTNYPEKSHATICLCFQPTLQAYSHSESQKLYINILNFYSCMRPGTNLSWRLDLWIWISMSESFCKAGRWSSSSAAGMALKLGHVCGYNIWIYVLPLHRPQGHTHKVVSHLNSQLHVTLALACCLFHPSMQTTCVLYPLPHSTGTMHSLRSQGRCCCHISEEYEVWTHTVPARDGLCTEKSEKVE